MGIVHLVETEHNFDSIVTIDSLMDACTKQGFSSVIVADHATLYSMVDLEKASRTHGVNVIYGCRFCLRLDASQTDVVMVAKTQQGIQNLITLSSKAHAKPSGERFITSSELIHAKDGLMAIAAFDGETADDLKAYGVILKGLKQLFQNDLYLEIHRSAKEDDRRAKGIQWLSSQWGIPLFASNRVCFIHREEADIREIRRLIKEEGLYRAERVNHERYFKTEQEMHEAYGSFKDALDNTNKLAEKVQKDARVLLKGDQGFVQKTLRFEVPKDVPIPTNWSSYFTPLKGFELPTDKESLRAIAYLCQLASEGFKAIYPEGNQEGRDRIKYELGVIISRGFTHYFLVVWDFVRFCHEHHIHIGPRGSAAGSLLAHCLGINQINPLKYGLLFERFLNPDRTDDPDIDIDVSNRYRSHIVRYAKERYGAQSVAKILTLGRFGYKNAVRNVRKKLEMTESVQSKIFKVLEKSWEGSLSEFAKSPKGKKLADLMEKDEHVRRIIPIADTLARCPSHISIHAAGLIVSSENLSNQVPTSVVKDEWNEDILLMCIPNNDKQLERLGYTKIDLLGLDTIDIPSDTAEWVRKNHGIEVSEPDLEDKKTWELFQSGKLTGVFQMDSAGMQDTCRKVKPTSIYDLMDILALYRPGPMKQIPTYVANKEKMAGSQSRSMEGMDMLAPILNQTHDILVYQEQIIHIANQWAGYTLAQADLLRQAISKKNEAKLKAGRHQFQQKAREMGRDPRVTERLFELILEFANYGFNRSHAAAYAYQCFSNAFLKAHYPTEYMAVRITASMSKYRETALSYVEDARRMAITIHPPDIRTSEAKFIPQQDGTIVFGLPLIKNVGVRAIEEMVEERTTRPFDSFQDFLARMKKTSLNRDAIEALIKVGACDSFGTRPSLLDELDGKGEEGYGVYGFHEIDFLDLPTPSNQKDWSPEERRKMERSFLGITFSSHPLTTRKQELDGLIQKKNGGVWVYGVVDHIRSKKDKNKNDMADITLDRIEGPLTLVVFQDLWKKKRLNTQKGGLILCRVKEESESRAIAQDIQFIE